MHLFPASLLFIFALFIYLFIYLFTYLLFIIIIIMFIKVYACFPFLDLQDEVGPSISSSVVLRSFVPLVYIVLLFLLVYLCPSSVRVVATFPGTVLSPLLCSVLPFFPLIHWSFYLSSFVITSKCLKNFICAASKRCSSLFLSTQASLPNFNAALTVILWILNFVSEVFNHIVKYFCTIQYDLYRRL